MRVWFDNNVPAPLRHRLRGHTVDTAREVKRHELENGDLLVAAEQDGFELLVTGDKNLSYQQNLAHRAIAIVVLPTIDWTVLRRTPEMIQSIVAAVKRATVGSFEQIY